jgi:hypothetical protein
MGRGGLTMENKKRTLVIPEWLWSLGPQITIPNVVHPPSGVASHSFLKEIRNWAEAAGLVDEPDLLVTQERVRDISDLFDAGDKLGITGFFVLDSVVPFYHEQIYVPVATLIKKGIEIELVWWDMVAGEFDPSGRPLGYEEVRFGFWCHELVMEEFYSTCRGQIVVKKFEELTREYEDIAREIPDPALPLWYISQGQESDEDIHQPTVTEVEVDGDIKARFFKRGRYFDVEFS